MSNKIDFSKAPEGATHWNGRPEQVSAPCFYKQIDGEWLYWYQDEDTEWIKCNGLPKPVNLFQIPPQWTIHNNDKPLRDLSDEQAAQLFNAWRKGDVLEMITDEYIAVVNAPVWGDSAIYRIKSKSEREEFVEKCNAAIGADGFIVKPLLEKIFDAIQRGDIKAPEVQK